MTAAQATAILAELEKTHQALPDESAVRKLKDKVEAVLRKHGVRVSLFKAIDIVPPSGKRTWISIILLTDPNDRARALAITDEGAPSDKPTPKKK